MRPPFWFDRPAAQVLIFFRRSHTGYGRTPNHFGRLVRSASEIKTALPRRGLFNMEVGNMEEAQVGNLEETLREGAPPHLKTLFLRPTR